VVKEKDRGYRVVVHFRTIKNHHTTEAGDVAFVRVLLGDWK